MGRAASFPSAGDDHDGGRARTERPQTWSHPRQAVRWFLQGRTVRTAAPTATVVGTVLSAVNQGAVIAGGHATGTTWVQVAINYAVPFTVASVGYLCACRTR
ncbi:nitrate/nitrite transporter NrtS [Amycolatopsis sp. K13G38]|uniref:Nitrate/nitrite transporter NrtS n=1 Tax=Amycolatopsis acididurans TaxID=2724524 RepID=A0ABX1J779_9PSEU|nr:nitrate/nitrite transporter NrtS [Amycolatopsis acididurans]NKQ55653.1 nitrate/nitrite transporter NrtS [Amycolatopsis acididurans]